MMDKIFKITTLQFYPYENKREVIIKLIYVIQNLFAIVFSWRN